MITDRQIEDAKLTTKFAHEEPKHEHNDCIRIAYEWLDAQIKTKNVTTKALPLKHIIEKWGGRYVSQSDVEVAATLHPDIFGDYPYYNINGNLTAPSDRRLEGISEAYTQQQRNYYDSSTYKFKENS